MDYSRLIGNFYLPDEQLKDYIKGYNVTLSSQTWETRAKLKTIPFSMAGILILLDNGKMNLFSEWKGIRSINKACVIGYNPIHEQQYMLPGSSFRRGLAISLTQLGVNHLLQLPVRELFHQAVDLELIVGNDAEMLYELLECSRSEKEMVSILDHFFLSLLKRERYVNQSFVYQINRIISYQQRLIKVNELADHLNLHERSLQRKFREEIGLTPKEFLQLFRFIRIFQLMTGNPAISIQDLIWHGGFYDQAHFYHEFHKITSFSPGDFFKSFQP